MHHTARGQGFNCLEPGIVDVLKILFRQGIDLRENCLIPNYHIAIIGENDVFLNIRYGSKICEINPGHN